MSKLLLLLSNLIRIGTALLPNAPITMRFRGFLYSFILKKCGKNFQVASNVIISSTETLVIENNVYFGPNTIILGPNITIKNNCLIGPNTVLVAGNHQWDTLNKKWKDSNSLKILINENVWVGANCTILANSEIPKNSVVGAGAVYNLTKCEESSLIGGVPAKKIKRLNISNTENINKY